MTELDIPPAALDDQESFEILRVWAAHEQQHVTIHSGLCGSAKDFGFLVAELALHGAKLYSQRLGIIEQEALNEILNGFNDEVTNERGNATGGYNKNGV